MSLSFYSEYRKSFSIELYEHQLKEEINTIIVILLWLKSVDDMTSQRIVGCLCILEEVFIFYDLVVNQYLKRSAVITL